jgi:hypothetical protein
VTSSSPAIRSAAWVAAAASSAGQVGRGGEDLGADPVGLDGLDDRPRGRLPGGAAGDEHGQLAVEGHELLEEDPVGNGPEPPVTLRIEPIGEVVDRQRTRTHPLAVVAAAGGLGDERPPHHRPKA